MIARYLRRAFLLLLAAAALAAGRIAWRNYWAEQLDFSRLSTSPTSFHPEQTGISQLREVRFPRKDSAIIAGWYAPGRNGATIILVHGSQADRSALLPETGSLAAAGFGVLAFDLAGYGASGGAIDWGPGERAALTAAIDWLLTQPGVDPQRIGGYGFSGGAYILAQVAAQDRRLRAVILAGSPNEWVHDVKRDHDKWGFVSYWPAQWEFNHAFGDGPDAVSGALAASRIAPRPVFIIGSSTDTVVPEYVVREIFAAAGEPKELWIIPGARHEAYPQAAGSSYGDRLANFFRRNL